MDGERHLAPRGGDEAVAKRGEVAGDQREQIGRLGEGVVPDRIVPAAAEIAAFHRVAV
jgi:hypothetical protein